MFDPTANSSKVKSLTVVQPFCLGIIDLGTNSIRLDVYRIDANLGISRLYRFKEMIRVGEDVFKRGYIKDEVILRSLVAFDAISKQLKEFNVTKTLAFATCALRDSNNAAEFIQKVRNRTGIQISVISGEEEASLIAKAILNNERTPTGYYGLMDIGGGSTEISFCYKNQVLKSFSLDLGSIRMHQKFFEPILPNPTPAALESAERKLREHVRSVLKPLLQEYRWPKVKSIVGSSGTIRAIWKIMRKSGKGVDPFKVEQVGRLVRKLLTLGPEELLRIPGMEEKRADIILPGSILFHELCRVIGCQDVYVTDCSLRDGILDWQVEQILHRGRKSSAARNNKLSPPQAIRQ